GQGGGRSVGAAAGGGLFPPGGGARGRGPWRAILLHRPAGTETADPRRDVPARLLYSSRRWDETIYQDAIARLADEDATLEVALTFTREPPLGWTGFRHRIDRKMLAEVAWPPSERPHVFVCGPTALVETAATALVEL